ncbi:MAG: NAD-dependent epimerase/dehydratase family protein [Gemmatimonadaceae bacterium]
MSALPWVHGLVPRPRESIAPTRYSRDTRPHSPRWLNFASEYVQTRIAVTGGTGFIGREIVRQCLARGVSPRVVTRRPDPASRLGPDSELVVADVATGAGLETAFRDCDALIHAAGLAHRHGGAAEGEFRSANSNGCRRVLLAAADAGISRVVLLSSISVYGGSRWHEPVNEGAACLPTTAYGRSKLDGEAEAWRIAQSHSVQLIVLRLATVYGAHDPGNLIRLIRAIDGRRFVRIGAGTVRKSLLHRADAARACLDAALRHTGGEESTFNVVGGTYSLDVITETIASALGRRLPRGRIPGAVARSGAALVRPIPRFRSAGSAIGRWLADEAYTGDLFEQVFSFRPEVGLSEGIRDEVDWYRRLAPVAVAARE